MFSVCLSVHIGGGGYLPSRWVGGYLLSGLDGMGEVPTFPGPGEGGTYFQVWMGGVPTLRSGWEGTYLPRSRWGGGTFWVGVPTHVWMGGYLHR